MDQRRKLIRLALFGQPIKASLSPKIQDIEFQRIETGAHGFAQALEVFRAAGGHGCNVTLPLKRDAWQLANDSSAEVRQAQAANTLLGQADGWFAYNTDGAGLVADLTMNHGIELAGKRILILGAGGEICSGPGNWLTNFAPFPKSPS